MPQFYCSLQLFKITIHSFAINLRIHTYVQTYSHHKSNVIFIARMSVPLV